MNIQIKLPLINKLNYKPENFLLHSGVSEIFLNLIKLVNADAFHISYIEGEPRSGKTHFSIKLQNELCKSKLFPEIIQGDAPDNFFTGINNLSKVVIVDDAELLFNSLTPDYSGSFVDLIERLRVAKGKIIFFGAKLNSENVFDNHVASRLNSGMNFIINKPEIAEGAEILKLIASQRGIKLSALQVRYIVDRINPSISLLEFVVDRIQRYSQIFESKINMPLIRKAVSEAS